MSLVYHIARKELRSYFASVSGYIFLTVLLLLSGFFFQQIFLYYAEISQQMAADPSAMEQAPTMTEFVLGNMLSNLAVVILIMTPFMTMRLVAEERRQHTLELLMTSPVGSLEIVLGKFFGALAFYAVALILTFHYPGFLLAYGSPDIGPMATGYLGMLLFGASCISFGLLASSLTQHQLVAGAVSFGFALFMWIIGWGANPGDVRHYLALTEHYDGFTKGFLRLESVTYYLSFIVFFLFATQQRLETMRRQ
jgi:ABC-2 type transport system permease protein